MTLRSGLLATLLFAMLIAACGDGGDGSIVPGNDAAGIGFPVSLATGDADVTIEQRPARVVSISPTATETLFAVGAGSQVVAVDSLSNHPAGAPVTDLDAIQPNLEAIAAHDPDLVVLSFDPGDVVAGLGALGIPVLVQPAAASLPEVYTQIEQLGAATGNVAGAAEVVSAMQTRIGDAVQSVARGDEEITYVYELDENLYTVTSDTFIGELYAMFEMTNIADPADAGGFGYPQLSAEYVLDADPDLIYLADTKCCGQSAATVAARPGWGSLSAVEHARVVELDDDVASRWGPRIAELVEAIAGSIRAFHTADV